MSDDMSLERMVATVMTESVSGTVPDRMIDDVLFTTGRMRPAPRWLALLKEPPMRADSRTAVGIPARRLVFVMTIVLLLIALAAAVAGASLLLRPPQTTSADWPMFRGDAARTGTALQGPIGRPILHWRYQAPGGVSGNIAIVGDLVFAPSDDGILHALGLADGRERWTFSPAGGSVSGPAAADGRIYVSDGAGTFYALDQASGRQIWTSSSSYAAPSAATADAGVVYLGTADGALVALDASTGVERWRSTISPTGGAANAPAVAGGLVYAGTSGGEFVAVDASTGKLVWRVDTGSESTGTAIVAAGIAYIGSSTESGPGGHLRAVDAQTGQVLWQVDGMNYSPTVADGIVYTASSSGAVGARDARSGVERWRFQVQGTARAPAVAGGVVYVAADTEHRVYALEASSGRELWQYDVDSANDCCIAVAKGSVFVGTALGGVYDIGGDGTAIAPLPAANLAPTAAASPTPAPSPASAPPSSALSPVSLLWTATDPAGAMFPSALTLGPSGLLWAADTANDRFAIFKPDGTFVGFWGESGSGDGQFDLTRANGDPYGAVVFEPDGSFFVLDVGNRRVQKFDPDRKFVRAWGGFGDAPGKYSDPVGIAVGPDGNLHVLDDVRRVIETYDVEGTVLGSIPAFPGIFGGLGANALAMDGGGNFYVSSVDPTEVLRLDPTGKVTATYGASGSGQGEFHEQPTGMAIDDAGRLYVTQGPERGDHPGVLVFDPSGQYLAGWGAAGTGDGDLGFPWGVALDTVGSVYVADYGPAELGLKNRIEKFGLLPPLGQ